MAGDLEPSLLEVVQDLYSPIVLHMQLVLGYRKNDEGQNLPLAVQQVSR